MRGKQVSFKLEPFFKNLMVVCVVCGCLELCLWLLSSLPAPCGLCFMIATCPAVCASASPASATRTRRPRMSSTRSSLLSSAPASRVRFVAVVVVVVVFFLDLVCALRNTLFYLTSVIFRPFPSLPLFSLFSLFPPSLSLCLFVCCGRHWHQGGR